MKIMKKGLMVPMNMVIEPTLKKKAIKKPVKKPLEKVKSKDGEYYQIVGHL